LRNDATHTSLLHFRDTTHILTHDFQILSKRRASIRNERIRLITLTSLLESELNERLYLRLIPEVWIQSLKICWIDSWLPHVQRGWGVLSRRYLWVKWLWPIRRRVMITDSFLFKNSKLIHGVIFGLIVFNLLFVTISHSLFHFATVLPRKQLSWVVFELYSLPQKFEFYSVSRIQIFRKILKLDYYSAELISGKHGSIVWLIFLLVSYLLGTKFDVSGFWREDLARESTCSFWPIPMWLGNFGFSIMEFVIETFIWVKVEFPSKICFDILKCVIWEIARF
jgi:hypothetical protein